MQKDFAMFSAAGNAAVEGVVDNAASHFDTFEDAYTWANAELEYLARTSTYSEADDTAVREAVWAALSESFKEAA